MALQELVLGKMLIEETVYFGICDGCLTLARYAFEAGLLINFINESTCKSGIDLIQY